MTDLLSIIRTRLIAASVANSTTWQCFIGMAPDTQDQVISLELTGGLPQDTHEGENVHQTFQVRVRTAHMAYAACETKWWAMYSALHGRESLLASYGIRLIQAQASGPLVYYDQENRVNMTANFLVTRDYA